MPVLVEYACGCIGLPPHEETAPAPHGVNERQAMAFIIRPCDGDSELQCTLREVGLEQRITKTETRTSRYLTLEECENVLQSVNFLLGDGYRFRELRHILQLHDHTEEKPHK